MGFGRALWLILVALAVPPLGLIAAGASWLLVGLFAAALLANFLLMMLGVLPFLAFGAIRLMISLTTAFLAIRAGGALPWLPWFRRWYAMPLWAALLFAVQVGLFQVAGIEAFQIPSMSMAPALLAGDYAVARSSRFRASPPGRGEVVVFRRSDASDLQFVRRVVGLPGDRVQLRNGIVYVNGVPAPRENRGTMALERNGGRVVIHRYLETLPSIDGHDARSFEILDEPGAGWFDAMAEIVVPEGSFFVLGDNRDDSRDSRMRGFGFAEIGRIDAYPTRILWSSDPDRIGQTIR